MSETQKITEGQTKSAKQDQSSVKRDEYVCGKCDIEHKIEK